MITAFANIEQCEEDILQWQNQREQLIDYQEYLERERDACIGGSKQWHKWNNKCITNNSKVYGLDTRIRKAYYTKAEAERKREISREDWIKAKKSLKIGNPAVVTTQDGRTRSTISINGNIYRDGDLMSVTHEGIRFTWRVQGLAGGEKLRLERLRARRIK